MDITISERKMKMNNKAIEKLSIHKRFLLFMNLDIRDQIMVLLKFFVPIFIFGGLIQAFLHCQHHNTNIMGGVAGVFVLVVFFLSLPGEKIEIISERQRYVRMLKIFLNIILGLLYFGIVTFGAAKLLYYAEKSLVWDDSILFYVRCLYATFCFIIFIWLVLWKYEEKLFFKLPVIAVKNTHKLYVENADFTLIENNQKTMELWLNDYKRRRIKIGDIVVFLNMDDLEKYVGREVTKLYYAAEFTELMAQTEIKKNDYPNFDNNLIFLNKHYTAAEQKKRGVIGIEFKPE